MSRILTLNLGASKVTLAEYNVGKGVPTLLGYGTVDMPSLDIADPVSIGAALPTALNQIMRERGIKPAPVVISLGGQAVFPRFAKIPATNDAAKLDQLVRYEIEQNVPFPIDEIVSDYQFTGTTPEGDRAAVIVAAKLDSVRAVTDVVRGMGLKLALVDVSPMAVLNALRLVAPAAGCSVVLDIGAKTTNLVIAENEKVYNRSIPVAGNTITKEIAQAFGCSFEEAEQLKRERGYVSLGGVTEDEDEIADRVSKVIRTVLTRLHAEISRSINFYRSQQGGSAPTQLYLTGGTVRLPQLGEFFQETLQVPVGYLNPFTRVGVGGRVKAAALEEDAFVLAESVGLALHAGNQAWIKINLLPPEIVDEARAMRRIPFVVVGALAFCAALGALWYAKSCEGEAVRARVEALQAENTRLNGLKAQLDAAQKVAEAEKAEADAFQRLLWMRSAAVRRLDMVRKSLQPGMWLTTWQPKKAGSAEADEEAAAVEHVNITVRTWDDVKDALEVAWRTKGGGTAAEIVGRELRKNGGEMLAKTAEGVVQEKAVDIVNDISRFGCLRDYPIGLDFASAPTVMPAKPAKKGKKK